MSASAGPRIGQPSKPKQVQISVTEVKPLGMTLVKHPEGSRVHSVSVNDAAKKSARGMILRSIRPLKGGCHTRLSLSLHSSIWPPVLLPLRCVIQESLTD